MMIIISHGNLLTADAEALVNTVNTVGVMGKGIALQFKRAFPANYTAYRAACGAGEVVPGRMFVFDTHLSGPRRYIINFPTKRHWREASQLVDIEAGLHDLVAVMRDRAIASVAVPALGCGNGGLEWQRVRTLVEQAFADLPDTRVLLFPPEGPPEPATMPVAAAPLRLTPGRTALIRAIQRYLTEAGMLDLRDGVTELEIQKICYFLQVLGQPLRLAFTPGRYGPYAESVHQVLQALEGHYLVGYGDRSAKVEEFRPIAVTTQGAEAAARHDHDDRDTAERIERLATLVAGYATPYSMELLATVHFAAHRAPQTTDLDELIERVRSWSGRKARLFTEEHITMAAGRLRETGLLPRSIALPA